MSPGFSFKEHDVTNQTPQETLHVAFYELGHVVEYFHKAKRYGESGYHSVENQKKEMSDFVSMLRFYCELTGLEFPYGGTSRAFHTKRVEDQLDIMVAFFGQLVERDIKSVVPTIVMGQLVLATQMYCLRRGWDFVELMRLGEAAYLDRMEDLRKYGKQSKQSSGG